MPRRMNTHQKLDRIHSAIQDAQVGNLDKLDQALDLVEGIRARHFYAAAQAETFGALQAADKVLSRIDLRRNSGEGTLGINAEVAKIIDQETGAHGMTLALDAIANDAEKWLEDDEDSDSVPVEADELMNYFANTARKALKGETTPATPPAPELLDSLKKMTVMASFAPLAGHEYDQGDIDEAHAAIAKAEAPDTGCETCGRKPDAIHGAALGRGMKITTSCPGCGMEIKLTQEVLSVEAEKPVVKMTASMLVADRRGRALTAVLRQRLSQIQDESDCAWLTRLVELQQLCQEAMDPPHPTESRWSTFTPEGDTVEYHKIVGKNCEVHIETRPPDCDRGKFLAILLPNDDEHIAMDRVSWPRWYHDLFIAKCEVEAWLVLHGELPIDPSYTVLPDRPKATDVAPSPTVDNLLRVMKQIARDADFDKDDELGQLSGRLIAIRRQARRQTAYITRP